MAAIRLDEGEIIRRLGLSGRRDATTDAVVKSFVANVQGEVEMRLLARELRGLRHLRFRTVRAGGNDAETWRWIRKNVSNIDAIIDEVKEQQFWLMDFR